MYSVLEMRHQLLAVVISLGEAMTAFIRKMYQYPAYLLVHAANILSATTVSVSTTHIAAMDLLTALMEAMNCHVLAMCRRFTSVQVVNVFIALACAMASDSAETVLTNETAHVIPVSFNALAVDSVLMQVLNVMES
jgi:hypothetical protein